MNGRIRYTFTGTVQGVGFRPNVYRTATSLGLAGFVCNAPGCVVVEIEGPPPAVADFLPNLTASLPPRAIVERVAEERLQPSGTPGFQIRESIDAGLPLVPIPPDTAPCAACLEEMLDPADRRFLYPFINCTDCGPRLTIVRSAPYDRCNTSMQCFPLCAECAREYADPCDRRFHAEPNACPVCGPHLRLLAADGKPCSTDNPLQAAMDAVAHGRILAVKSVGGFHLCVDAGQPEAVARLRRRKSREQKPLAVMVADVAEARKLARVSEAEARLLSSPERPIVLLRKRGPTRVSEAVAPGVPAIGIMLPAAPPHHLMLRCGFSALVMTSANQRDEPICIGNREALTRLAGIADLFLTHNRDILVRCDDSIAMVAGQDTSLLRRARGYVPRPISMAENLPAALGIGGHLKTTVCLVRDREAFMSPHIGDLETPEARDFLHTSIDLLQQITGIEPEVVGCDLHPDYYTARLARQRYGSACVPVQHHHAHIVSCMAENGVTGQDVLGIAMDGTGYGTDGRIWGGEFLLASERRFTRAGHLACFQLPGGDAAVREPWRIAVSLLRRAFEDAWPAQAAAIGLPVSTAAAPVLEQALQRGVNCPETSSAGRLFDGVAALLGLRHEVSFEGQAAMELEAAAGDARGECLPCRIIDGALPLQLDTAPLVRAIVERRRAGVDPGELAAAFHTTLARAAADMAARLSQKLRFSIVALSGGCFQNRLLLQRCRAALAGAGFTVICHQQVPTSDGGLALGQAVIAAATRKGEKTGD